jgi:hypothetical protein
MRRTIVSRPNVRPDAKKQGPGNPGVAYPCLAVTGLRASPAAMVGLIRPPADRACRLPDR